MVNVWFSGRISVLPFRICGEWMVLMGVTGVNRQFNGKISVLPFKMCCTERYAMVNCRVYNGTKWYAIVTVWYTMVMNVIDGS